jgi:hypothetical protein
MGAPLFLSLGDDRIGDSALGDSFAGDLVI